MIGDGEDAFLSPTNSTGTLPEVANASPHASTI
jgi:hypothetical protein